MFPRLKSISKSFFDISLEGIFPYSLNFIDIIFLIILFKNSLFLNGFCVLILVHPKLFRFLFYLKLSVKRKVNLLPIF